ncbi:MAG: hypothetical protein R3195_08585 [Gemmatimonadota bacterium]|nr:hypothetical protein [Gemmatimonadota bacterium]
MTDRRLGGGPSSPTPWGRFRPRGLGWRLFGTAWIVFSLHFATDIVREHYPAIALGDHLTFRLDEYGGLHPDLFETPGRGWHIGNNPGISMFAAIPYALSRPVIDPIVERVRRGREAAGLTEPPVYDTEWPNQRAFFAEAWRRGLDVKLALAALVTQVLFMAPICAGAVVLMFAALRHVFGSDRTAGLLSLLFAFGTPLFYRAGFLNHNMVLGLIAFAAFVAIWDPGGTIRPSVRNAFVIAGLAAGLTLLFDYSGVVFVLLLFGYAHLVHRETLDGAELLKRSLWFGVGGAPPVFLLWFYQWRAFGNPFLPGQHWMPPVEWIELGYQGYGPPQLELLWVLAFDHRFGLFVVCPLLLLAFVALVPRFRESVGLPGREAWFCIAVFTATWVFFSGSNYTRLQFNTGMRYMAPVVPFLFVPAAVGLMRLPRQLGWLVAALSVLLTWALAMYREVERPLGVLDPVIRTLTEGLELPVLAALERTGGAYGGLGAGGTSAIGAMLAAAVLIAVVWVAPRGPGRDEAEPAR